MIELAKESIRDWSKIMWEHQGFPKRVKAWLEESIDTDDIEDIGDIMQEVDDLLPDLFTFNGGQVRIIHIDDPKYVNDDISYLTEDKIIVYCQMWSALDFYNLELEVIVTDRFGLNPRTLPLSNYFLSMLPKKGK